jgi:hypothetical protein
MIAFTRWAAVAVVSIATPMSASPAQTIASRVNAVRDGTVLMTFATRPGVCGDGRGSTWTRRSVNGGDSYNGRSACIPGPMTAAIGRAGGEVVSIRTWIGGPRHASAPETSIGDVPPAEAAHYLLSLARAGSGRSADEAIAAAGMESRKQALFWLGQSREPRAVKFLRDIITR